MQEDRTLVEACVKGDESALSEILGRYQRPLYAVIYPLVLDPATTEDVLQEAFVRFWRSIHRFDTTRPVFPWLRRIAVNLALSELGAKRGGQVCLAELPEGSVPGDAEASAIHAEEIERIEAAMTELEPARRQTLALRAIGGLSYQEIADAMECSIGTVMSRLFRARMELRQRLGSAFVAEIRA